MAAGSFGLERLISLCFWVIIATQLFFSLNNFCPTWYWYQEVSINFGCYWLLLHSVSALVVLGWKIPSRRGLRYTLATLLLLLSATYFGRIAKFYLPPSREIAEPMGSFSAVHFEASSAAQAEDIADVIRSKNPDLVGLTGLTEESAKALSFGALFPYSRVELKPGFPGVALFSRFPFVTEPRTAVGEKVAPIVSVALDLGAGNRLQVILFQTQPFLARRFFYTNRILARRVSTPLRQVHERVLVFGNFNATPFSGLYKRFRDAGKLRDAMQGFGFDRTWSAENPFLRLTLSHFLYRGMDAIEYRRLAEQGSEHYPIMARFEW